MPREGRRNDTIETLYREHGDEIYRYVMSRVGDWALAQDLTNETFLRAHKAFDSYVDRGRPMVAWLVTIARNLVLDQVTSARSRHETVMELDFVVDTWVAPDDPLHETVRREAAVQVRAAVRRLPSRQEKCVFLRFYLGLTVEQASREMALTSQAIRALQHRAVRKLREFLAAS